MFAFVCVLAVKGHSFYTFFVRTQGLANFLCWGLTIRQPLWVILCRLSGKGRKEIEEMKDRDREERGTVMKGNKQLILAYSWARLAIL